MVVVATFNTKKNGVSGTPIQGSGSGSLQGGSTKSVQGSIPVIQGSSPNLQPAVNPMNYRAVDAPAAKEVPVVDPAVLAAQAAAARTNELRGQVRGYQGDVDSIYNQLFSDLDLLIQSRAGEIDRTAGDSINKLTEQYTGAIPGIESSYAALGAGDSTDSTYAKVDAKKGYEDSLEDVGEQKAKDQATLGSYDETTRANFGADRDALARIFARLDETDNDQDLIDARNAVETKLGTARASKASLMTDEGLKGKIKGATDSSSRVGSIQSSLDNVLNSTLSGAVKQAAIAAAGTSAGLTDEEKNQIKANNAFIS